MTITISVIKFKNAFLYSLYDVSVSVPTFFGAEVLPLRACALYMLCLESNQSYIEQILINKVWD